MRSGVLHIVAVAGLSFLGGTALPDGADVRPEPPAAPEAQEPVGVVFHLLIDSLEHDEHNKTVLRLGEVSRFLRDQRRGGQPVLIVMEGDARALTVGDQPARTHASAFARFIRSGVSVEISAREADPRHGGVDPREIIPGVVLLPSVPARLIELQAQGYAYIRL